jgi:Ca2+-binding EF-hand superfamily protein
MNEINKIRYKEAFLLMYENNKGVITVDDVHICL